MYSRLYHRFVEKLADTERHLDVSKGHSQTAADRTDELKQLNRSIFRPVITFNKDAKRAAKQAEIQRRYEDERSERERHKLQKQQQRASAGGGAGPGPDGRAPRQHQHQQHAREGSVRKVIGLPGSGMNGADAVLAPAVGSLCVGVEEIIADVVERESRARGDVSSERPLEVPIEELMKPGRARRSKGEFAISSFLRSSCGY